MREYLNLKVGKESIQFCLFYRILFFTLIGKLCVFCKFSIFE